LGLVVQVPADLGDAVGQGQGHAGVVSEFTGVEAVRPAAAVAGHRRKGAWGHELDRSTETVADRHADQRPSATISLVHDAPFPATCCNAAGFSRASFFSFAPRQQRASWYSSER